MKRFLVFLSVLLVGLFLTLTTGFMEFSAGALFLFIVGLVGTVAGLIGSVTNSFGAVSEFAHTVRRAKEDVTDRICRALDAKMTSYYGHYSTGDIARHLLAKDEKNLNVSVTLPSRWDYTIALPLVKYDVHKYIRDKKKQEAFTQKTKEVKVKL